jgi:hypothetical protein
MLFDNRGGDPACGGSRILELDYATQAVTWSYDACGAAAAGGPRLLSELRGMQQVLPNGNVLITESLGGRVLEVTRDDKAIVWEYVNGLGEVDGTARVGLVTHAERLPEGHLTFLPPR